MYRGASSIDKFMPSDSSPAVIKMSDFDDDMKSLAEYLKKLASDEDAYNEYFVWKGGKETDRFQSILDMTAYKFTSLCRICQRLVDDGVA